MNDFLCKSVQAAGKDDHVNVNQLNDESRWYKE